MAAMACKRTSGRLLSSLASGGVSLSLSLSRPFFSSSSSPPTHENIKSYDVVVVGGGMIGSALACLLKAETLTRELRVAVVDRAAERKRQEEASSSSKFSSKFCDNQQIVPDLRVSTLTPATMRVLTKVGIADKVGPPLSAPFDSMQVWEKHGDSFMRFTTGRQVQTSGFVEENEKNGGGVSSKYLGHVIENELLKEMLQERAQELGCEFIYGQVKDLGLPQPEVGITKLQGEGKGNHGLARITFEEEQGGGPCITTPLVVGCDGSNSFVAKEAGIRASSRNYGQRAVTCTVSTKGGHSTAFQRFLPTGPIALLPVRDGFSNIVWSTTVAEAEYLEGLGPKEFAREVNEAFHSRPEEEDGGGGFGSLGSALRSLTGKLIPSETTGKDEFVAPPEVVEVVGMAQRSFPLRRKHVLTYCQRGVVLAGDAAHSIHPLAGQGVNIGFGDVDALVATIQEALWSGQNYSDLLTLEKYSSKRKVANAALISALDAVKVIYQSQATPLALARNWGMGILNSSDLLKNLIVGYASSNADASKIIVGHSRKMT